MPTPLDHSTLRPPVSHLRGRYILLAVLVHVALIIAISLNINWRSETPPPAQAELWSEAQLITPVAAPQQQKAPPTPQKTKQPDPIQEPMGQHADIALKQKRLEEERKAAEAKRLEDERLAKEKKEAEDKAAADKAAADKAAADKAAEAKRLKDIRDKQIRGIQDSLGSGGSGNSNTGAVGSTGGTGVSPGYAAKLSAYVRERITYPGDRNQNIATEIYVETDKQGNIKVESIKIKKSSGNPQWDDAVIKALQKTGQLPADGGKRPETKFNFVFSPRD